MKTFDLLHYEYYETLPPMDVRLVSYMMFTTFLSLGCTKVEMDLVTQASDWQKQLEQKILPYWYDTSLDSTNGGYILADDGQGGGEAKEKAIVTQARMIWSFSHAHLKGFSTDQRNYLQAAEQGYRFLKNHFLDQEHGGYFWSTDLEGQVLNNRKILYGEVFVIYALVEYHRASEDKNALDQAKELYRVLQKRTYDTKHGGWLEHFERDWQPILTPETGAYVEVPGYKSANTHLHLMEALSELYQETGDNEVRDSLQEALRINKEYFYPENAGDSAFHRQPNWQPVSDPKSAGLSYGHNVEFAWLMIRAQESLNIPPDWPHFYANINHALKYGYDHKRGGLFYLGYGDNPATRTDKIWWVQSEMLAALSEALKHQPDETYESALKKLIQFIHDRQQDPKDGIWFDTVTAEGNPIRTGKAHNWKGAYHDLRAIMKFIDAFSR